MLFEILNEVGRFVITQRIAYFLDGILGMGQQAFGFQHHPVVNHFLGCFAYGFAGSGIQTFLGYQEFAGIELHLFLRLVILFQHFPEQE